ncbi:MAG: universal stress protein [Alphaproteobacteria bacterium]|nr:universal stress protein [Alphaproteobacteria bacterium]
MIKDILVHMDASPASRCRLDVASATARRFDAHVTGLFVKSPPVPVGFALADAGFLADNDTAAIAAGDRASVERASIDVEKLFCDRLARDQVAFDWWTTDGTVARDVSHYARCVDLVILGQPYRDGDSLGGEFSVIGDILLEAGRPILIVPHFGSFPIIGDHALVAWNASREAARAIHDALPFLVTAKTVTVLSVDPTPVTPGARRTGAADVVRHLARHGVQAKAASAVGSSIPVGDLIVSRAADVEADLIVMGAYGHSRLRELLLGGATRTLLETMTVPVLMSH